MREREMRQRIERFLQSRLRKMLAPATIGLGLAMTGCPSSGLDAIDDAGAQVERDAGADSGMVAVYSAPAPDAGPVSTKYIAPIPDAGREASMPQPEYMAPLPDSGPVLRYMAQMPDASPDSRGAVALYMAMLPESQS
jgi:hypothetical protein